jgi:hypothetical protein
MRVDRHRAVIVQDTDNIGVSHGHLSPG